LFAGRNLLFVHSSQVVELPQLLQFVRHAEQTTGELLASVKYSAGHDDRQDFLSALNTKPSLHDAHTDDAVASWH